MKRPYTGDIFVALLALLIMLVALFPWRGAGEQLEITVRGEQPQVYDLTDERVLTFQNEYTNVIQIKRGQARFAESTCPNQTCVHTGWISKAGEAAVCTATGVVVRILGDDIDAVIG